MGQEDSHMPAQGEFRGTKRILLVNGPPASGKTSVALEVVGLLHLPFLSLDTVKEQLFDYLGTGNREYNRLLGRTSLAIIWSLIADFPQGGAVTVEAWFGSPPREFVIEGLHRAGAGVVAELWCHASAEVLASRYVERAGRRHPGHPDEEYAPELLEVSARASPLAVSPVLSVDTTDLPGVDIRRVARWVAEVLGLSSPPFDA